MVHSILFRRGLSVGGGISTRVACAIELYAMRESISNQHMRHRTLIER